MPCAGVYGGIVAGNATSEMLVLSPFLPELRFESSVANGSVVLGISSVVYAPIFDLTRPGNLCFVHLSRL